MLGTEPEFSGKSMLLIVEPSLQLLFIVAVALNFRFGNRVSLPCPSGFDTAILLSQLPES